MKIAIDLPVNIINQLLIDNACFRQYIIDTYLKPTDDLDYYRQVIRTEFPDWNTNKLSPIKWIRDFTRNSTNVLHLFSKNGYEVSKPSGGDAVLSILGAKQFIESIK